MPTLSSMFIVHFIADFLFQSREMGKRKSTEWSYLITHCIIIFIMFLLLTRSVSFAGANAIIHGVIDKNIWTIYKLTVKYRYRNVVPNEFKYWDDHLFYSIIGLDQLLHGLTLIYLRGLYV